jgi:hypothetical protein
MEVLRLMLLKIPRATPTDHRGFGKTDYLFLILSIRFISKTCSA